MYICFARILAIPVSYLLYCHAQMLAIKWFKYLADASLQVTLLLLPLLQLSLSINPCLPVYRFLVYLNGLQLFLLRILNCQVETVNTFAKKKKIALTPSVWNLMWKSLLRNTKLQLWLKIAKQNKNKRLININKKTILGTVVSGV